MIAESGYSTSSSYSFSFVYVVMKRYWRNFANERYSKSFKYNENAVLRALLKLYCNITTWLVNNGVCHPEYNNQACGFDQGNII